MDSIYGMNLSIKNLENLRDFDERRKKEKFEVERVAGSIPKEGNGGS